MDPDLSPDTVTEAIDLLRADGYTADFELTAGQLEVDSGGVICHVSDAIVERRFRFEGPSDPGDEMIVFGLRDPATEVRGTLAAAYGHSADPAVAEHLADLSNRFRG